tara:strand:+ start:194 stop:472 length:279 start_codon:yes stop_codon:yes gene_type:complete
MGLLIICLNLVQILNLEAIIQIQNQVETIQNQVEIIIIQGLAMITNLLILDILPAIIPDQVIVHHRLVLPEGVRLVRPEGLRLEVVKLVNKN